MAPVVLELRRRGVPNFLVHTGQHYDAAMSKVFFDDLGMPAPDVDLGVGSDTPSRQTARIMTEFERVCRERRPELVLVGGDVTSTLAVALVAAKEGIPLGHVEAGLRSFDRTMPEEINRVVTDHVSDYLFTTEESANQNLRREGVDERRVHFVGNCMVDTLKKHLVGAIARRPWEARGLEPGRYGVLTLHRPSNVDSADALVSLMQTLDVVGAALPILFPVHPRTRARLEQSGVAPPAGVRVCEPLPYEEFLGVMAKARLVLTDSGGIQEETTALSIPCLTLRENTERPVTLTHGTNRLVGLRRLDIERSVERILSGDWPAGGDVPLWDGKASSRIVDVLMADQPARAEEA
jgi:UDP-N-acetylglucosamine 2-epimerase (non-hydrolysing)